MRISVSDRNLSLVLARFKPDPNAQMEFNVNAEGIDIVANRRGWLTLARWCLVMAHPEMELHDEDEWLHAGYHLSDYLADDAAVDEGRVLLSFFGIADKPSEGEQDVRFYSAPRVGSTFWRGARRSGNSPRTVFHDSSE